MNVRLEGEVQGVGLRDFCVREANNRGLKGWVRNRSDGTVEMVVAGRQPPKMQLDSLLQRFSVDWRSQQLELITVAKSPMFS